MDKDARHRLGRRAERVAAWRLWWRGYRILARNWHPQRYGQGEVDIVARHRGVLVIVEVKAHAQTGAPGEPQPEEQVDFNKQRRLCRLLDAWRAEHNAWDAPCRVDVVGVVFNARGRVVAFRVWPDAFEYIGP